ncbi:olfactory receptor 1-like [Bombina bombina]|uniref:olfactory receptor 1-like n=1 Tax=Bombina bombina TaxID=8345 RepID=UPI00235A6D77|nr:olfactory receptor 1-like [Bombina bombina]
MGSNVAPTYANLFVGKFEEDVVYRDEGYKKSILGWYCYIDDIFFIWTGSDDGLTQFVSKLNSAHESLKFTIEASKSEMICNENDHNKTQQRDFNILPFSVRPESQLVLFVGLLVIYLMSVLGNLIITTVIILDNNLHNPMYFLLCNLSILDITFISVTLPKLLAITMTDCGTMSFNDCIAQMYFFIATANTESLLLTSMAYDRYVAICDPLRYSIIMNKTSCFVLAIASWLIGFLNSLLLSLLTSNLFYCRSHLINNFFCDLKAMLELSCSDTTLIQTIILVDNVLIGFIPSMLTMMSYVYIISTVLKIHSSQGRIKAFSNCTSHLTTVLIFYGTALCLYMSPYSEVSENKDNILSLAYVALIPMVNPVVYSLRNKDVRGAMIKITSRQIKNMIS